MKYKLSHAFTLIEMAAVIVIILVLVGISLPLLNKGSSHHEAKFAAFSIQNLMSMCNTMARSAGKVYVIDMNLDYNFKIDDPSNPPANPPNTDIFRTKMLNIYCASWNETSSEVVYTFSNESYEIPVSLGAYFDTDNGDEDYIFFKPDGSISSKGNNIIVCPDNNHQLYYKITTSKATGNIEVTSYKD